MSRHIHTLFVAAALGLAALPAAAQADGVLLSGYAPPGAGEESLLGTVKPSGGGGEGAGTGFGASSGVTAQRARGTLALAQPVAAGTSFTKSTTSSGTSPARRHGASSSKHTTSAAPATASAPAAVAAAAGRPAGTGIGPWAALLAGALAIITFGLARSWRRQDR